MTPPKGYSGGKVYFRITDAEPGVDLYFSKNGVKDNGLIPKDGYNQWNNVKNGEKIIVSAVPQKDNYNTSFTLEYYTDGTKNDDAPIFDKLEEHQDKISALIAVDGEGLSGGAIAGIVIGGVLIPVFILGIVIRNMNMKKDQDTVVKLHDAAGSH